MQADRPPLAGEFSAAEIDDQGRYGEDLEMGGDLRMLVGIEEDLLNQGEFLFEEFFDLGAQGVADIARFAGEVEENAGFLLDELLEGFEGHIDAAFMRG